jgi:flagellar biosynthetic protein FliP
MSGVKDHRTCFRELLRKSHQRAAAATGLILGIGFLISWGLAWAQTGGATPAEGGVGLPEVNLTIGGGEGDAATLIRIMLLFTLITLAPSIVVMVTPFTRIVIVLGLLRNALGTQQSPPNTVLIGLALFLSLFVMMPVLARINTDAVQPYFAEEIGYDEALGRAQAPLHEFMVRQTRDKDLALFANLAKLDTESMTISEVPMHVLIPAFMISELKSAFQIGFIIYLPFLVVDMVTSSILMSMGMLMLPPILISLPFKLLMFILSDGWNLVFGSIVRSFK